MRTAFEGEGWNVVEVGDCEVGLMRIAERPPAAIVIDFNKLCLDGFGFLEKLEKNPDLEAIPVLVLAVSDVDGDERGKLLKSVDMVVEKGPYCLDVLLRRLRELLEPLQEEVISGREIS